MIINRDIQDNQDKNPDLGKADSRRGAENAEKINLILKPNHHMFGETHTTIWLRISLRLCVSARVTAVFGLI